MRSGDVAPRMGVTLTVEECLGVGQRAQDGLAVRLVGNGIESGLQPVREVTGRPFGGQGFDAHLGEGLMVNQDNMHAAALAATLGHDDSFRVGTFHGCLSSLWREVRERMRIRVGSPWTPLQDGGGYP